MKHVTEAELSLYTTGDVTLWRRGVVRLHLRQCESCQARAEAYLHDRQRLRQVAGELPPHVDWDRMAAEMTANIRVGLAAGECVAVRQKKQPLFRWQPVAIAAGAMALLTVAWMLNIPASDNAALARSMKALVSGTPQAARDSSPILSVSREGVELQQNGSSMGISQGTLRPVAVSVNVDGSASARYVDADAGQVTISSVYVQ